MLGSLDANHIFLRITKRLFYRKRRISSLADTNADLAFFISRDKSDTETESSPSRRDASYATDTDYFLIKLRFCPPLFLRTTLVFPAIPKSTLGAVMRSFLGMEDRWRRNSRGLFRGFCFVVWSCAYWVWHKNHQNCNPPS